MSKFLGPLLAAILFISLVSVHASSMLPTTLDEQLQSAHAIFRGTVLEIKAYKNPADGMIYTRTLLRVDETLKGKFPPVIKVLHRGGEVDGIGMMDDLSPRFKVGEQCVLLVLRRSDGTLFAAEGEAGVLKLRREKNGAFLSEHKALLDKIRVKISSQPSPGEDVTDQAANVSPDGFVSAPSGDSGGNSTTNGLLADSFGVPMRYPTPDRGEPVPYLVDATLLPTGINLPQALNAVSNAFAAWSAASSFRFVFAGTNNFGQAPFNINTNDGVIRIQLHDAYNFIPAGNIVGEGGSYYSTGLLANANWGPGGNVNGTEFDQCACGSVVIKHTSAAMQTLSTFTEVLTHEIGHVLGLAHSSEITTNDATLNGSIMYYTAHADGRGAKLNGYDTNVVRVVHPLNPPPYSYRRFMDITTASVPTNLPGINQIDMRGYSLQTTNLNVFLTNQSVLNGSFTNLTNTIVRYKANGVFGDSGRLDPGANTFYDQVYARHSDGSNASPYVTISVVSYNFDSGSPSDGIPDTWMINYFGNANPAVGSNHKATNDFDGDGLNNLQEYIAGMNPTNKTSAQSSTLSKAGGLQWQAKAYELYEVQSATNLNSTNWTRFGNPILPTTSTGSIANPFNPAVTQQFFRIQKVP